MATSGRETQASERRGGRNVGDLERLISVAAGGALAAYAVRRRDTGGVVAGLLGAALVHRGVTGHCYAYEALDLDSVAHGPRHGLVQRHGAAAVVDASEARRVVRAVTVADTSPDALFAFWRDFTNLPRIMQHLERVDMLDDTRSRWVVRGPAGRAIEWEAEVYNEIPGQLIAWRTLHDADVPNAGSVRFRAAPGGRGTEVRVEIEYQPPAGRLGALVARLFGEDPDAQVREDLRRFKQLIEAGEIPVGAMTRAERRRGVRADAPIDDPRSAALPGRPAPHDPSLVPTPADVVRGTSSVPAASPEVRV